MPCYVTYKVRQLIKDEDLESFKTLAGEHRLGYMLDKTTVDGKSWWRATSSSSSLMQQVMEDLTAQKMVKEAKKRNWKVKEVKAKVKA